MKAKFIHLRVHSEYSLVDGLVRIDDLVKSVVEAEMPAVAITDQANMFAVVKFYKAAEAAGIKAIIGADIWLENPLNPMQPFNLLLLCQNNQGYRNLTTLISRAYMEGQQHDMAQVKRAWLQECNEGLIALSGARLGDIGQALLKQQPDEARLLLDEWLTLFPQRFYIELQRTGRDQEDDYIIQAIDLAHAAHAPIVATNDVRFIKQDDFLAHEARVCIHEGYTLDDPKRPKRYSSQQYLRTQHDMQQLFADLPEALANSVEIAKRCTVTLTLGKAYLPDFPIPVGYTVERYFAEQSQLGLEKRLAILFRNDTAAVEEKRKPYDDRLQIELDVINEMGFAGYFLIVADFIQWSKNNGIPVGPGRGSGAGSLVAYALGITDLDPLQYDLLFERFLNPERVSMPDFDVDFCMDGRDRVIDYVAQKYGRHCVSQIITYGTMAAKAVVRDVGRVQGHPYGFVDKIAKLIPMELGITLEKALADEVALRERYAQEEDVATLLDLALKLEGITRNAGKHAGGVVIAPTTLTDFSPLFCEPGSDHYVTQFDKDDVEAVGLVKFDFLGLRTLTIINWAVQAVNKRLLRENKPPIDISLIPVDDPAPYELLKACATTAVFQLESRGMKDLIKRLQPDCFEEIIALVA
ncbi:MAG: DNA polymerase III subunit alpha, partial [Gammaproteobacteria bacterium]